MTLSLPRIRPMWSRDRRGCRVLNPPNNAMKEVIDNKFWGLMLKLILGIMPIFLPVATGILWNVYGTMARHARELESLAEWRKSHQEITADKMIRITALEKANAMRELETAILKEKLGTISYNTEKISASVAVMSDQFIRLQQTATESREKLVNLQVQLDDVKSKQ